ncbi:hypothetical protein CFOL_v3_13821 [Cephalotus follicularis]|uniref:Poly(A) RNA polymerase mitochondrial-like central palm domain-containing protein n=1 Tax=Cephalotus follicularis TaxID=3775 RepID=A0A1Q3BRH8_CEPFO|nr:hypothetical protein CFOL_v3_13821 [Cephalotus follicularis]
MSSNNLLGPSLEEILSVIKPLRDDWVTRFKIIDELRHVVESMESLRGATVEPYGSFVSNLFSRSGDLDISIELPNGSYISSAGKKRKLNLLGEVLIALRQKGGWRRMKFISNARVPILKFESINYRISCDLSVDNLPCQMKSKFLFWISEIDNRFRDMVLLVKEWAKAHDINNSKAGTFNSYSLSLLVIFHFQTCVPAILPPLRDIYPGNVVDDLIGVRANAERDIAERCVSNIARFRSDKFRPVNRSSLCELFVSFLAKFSDIRLRGSELGICTFTGKWEEIRSNMRWLPKTYAIFIEDPFEQPENTARSVSARQLTKISEAFETTRRWLISPNKNQNSILAAIVGPQIPHFQMRTPVISLSIARRAPVTYPSYSSGRNFPPQAERASHSAAQVDRNPQNMRREFRSRNLTTQNHETHDPDPQDHSQSQQTWRPKSVRQTA